MREQIEIYLRKSGDTNLLMFHVPEGMKQRLIQGLQAGGFAPDDAEINFEMHVRDEWRTEDSQNHIRLPVDRITFG